MSIIRQLARVANRIDSASTGTFLSKGDSTGDFTLVNYTDLSGRPTTLDSAALTSIVDSAYIQLRQTSAGSGGLDSAGITALVDSNYVVARSPAASSGFAQYEYTATAGQTTFQDSDINGNVMSYTADGIFVFYNGVLIAPTTDYTASDGSSVVLTTGADSGSHVAISKWNIASGGGSGGSATNRGDRGLFAGDVYSPLNRIDYVDISTPGNASDFGDLSFDRNGPSAFSNGTYGVFASTSNTGTTGANEVIDYVTIATPSNATDFGDMAQLRSNGAGCADGTTGLIGTGITSSYETGVDYVTIATPSNATNFGNLTVAGQYLASCADDTYGVWAGGNNRLNTIDYVTIASPSNATDFGDLTEGRNQVCGCGDGTYGVFISGVPYNTTTTIDYITFATPSNATDFGDTHTGLYQHSATSNDTTGIYGGGANGSGTIQSSIYYITIATTGNAASFGNLTGTRQNMGGTSGSPS